jgi:hypothetical protein
VNISVSPPVLHKLNSERTKASRVFDSVMRKRVEEVSNKVHTYREPEKVRGPLYHVKGPPPVVCCPIDSCTSTYYKEKPLDERT